MPRIEQIETGPVTPRPFPGQTIDLGSAVAPYQGMAAVGGAIGDVGDIAGSIAMKMQAAKNEGDLAAAELEMLNADAEQQEWMQSEAGAGDETTWEPELAKRLEITKEKVLNEKIAPVVKRRLESQFAEFSARQTISVRNQVQRRQLEKGKAAMVELAEAKVRQLDFEGAVDQIKKAASVGHFSPEQERAEIERIYNYGGYYMATQELAEIEAIPSLREQKAQLDKFSGELMREGKDGKFERFEYDGGGMSARGRIEMQSNVQAKARAVEKQMDRNALTLIRQVKSGDATLADVMQASDEGQIPLAVFGPDQVDPALRTASDVAQQKKEETRRRKIATQQGRFESLSKDALQDFTAGDYDIDVAIQRGDITPQMGSELRTRMQVLSVAQESRSDEDGVPTFGSISDRLDSLYAVGALGLEPKKQPKPEVYRTILSEINSAELTVPNRLKLVERLFEAKLADISDLEEEGTGRWLDRDITPPEAKLRSEIIRTYQPMLPALGLQQAGALLFGQEQTIIDFFEGRSKPPTDSEYNALRDTLQKQARQAASTELIRASFGY